jgi:UTP--glucose-1-phosphate uridylyltransferase
MTSVRKAIVPVAGLGTRLLPVTKSQPKEMLPVGRKPTVQYIVEELEQAGIHQILLVTGRKKSSIEDHFDPDPELIQRLGQSGNAELVEAMSYLDDATSLFYVRQSTPRGNGDAVRLGRDFAGNEPFVVAFGDSIIFTIGQQSLLQRMMEAMEATGASCVLAVEEVAPEDAYKYGVVQPKGPLGDTFAIEDLIEKPAAGSAPSNLAIAARYLFAPNLFEAIDLTMPGKGGELWLADSIRVLLKQGHPVWCVRLSAAERRYDIGNFESYFKAFVDFALADERYGYLLRQHLQQRLG